MTLESDNSDASASISQCNAYLPIGHPLNVLHGLNHHSSIFSFFFHRVLCHPCPIPFHHLIRATATTTTSQVLLLIPRRRRRRRRCITLGSSSSYSMNLYAMGRDNFFFKAATPSVEVKIWGDVKRKSFGIKKKKKNSFNPWQRPGRDWQCTTKCYTRNTTVTYCCSAGLCKAGPSSVYISIWEAPSSLMPYFVKA